MQVLPVDPIWHPVTTSGLPSLFFGTDEFKWEEMQKRTTRSIKKGRLWRLRAWLKMEIEIRYDFSLCIY